MALKDHGYFTGVVGKWHLGAPRLIYPGDASPHYQDYEFLERQNNLTLQHCKDFGFDVAERVYRSNVGAVEVNNDIPWELKFHNLEWVTGGATSFLDQVASPPPPPIPACYLSLPAPPISQPTWSPNRVGESHGQTMVPVLFIHRAARAAHSVEPEQSSVRDASRHHVRGHDAGGVAAGAPAATEHRL